MRDSFEPLPVAPGKQTPREIPLRNRAGEVLAVALVDDADYESLNRHRWCLSNGYAVRGTESNGIKRRHAMHRQILGLKHGDRRLTDHIDGDPLNNQRSNLRIVTQAQNMQNRRHDRIGKSQYRGVSWLNRERLWRGRVTINYREHVVGYFKDEEEAAAAVAAFRAEYMPFSEEAQVLYG